MDYGSKRPRDEGEYVPGGERGWHQQPAYSPTQRNYSPPRNQQYNPYSGPPPPREPDRGGYGRGDYGRRGGGGGGGGGGSEFYPQRSPPRRDGPPSYRGPPRDEYYKREREPEPYRREPDYPRREREPPGRDSRDYRGPPPPPYGGTEFRPRDNRDRDEPRPKRAAVDFGDGPEDAGRGGYATTMLVPSVSMGMLIGKGGSTRQEISQESGARIRIQDHQDVPDGMSERAITIQGSWESVSKAESMVLQKLEARKQALKTETGVDDGLDNTDPDPKQVFRWLIPVEMVGLLIGKRGAGLQAMMAETGSKIRVSNEEEMPPGCPDRIVTIVGRREERENACRAIQNRVGGRPIDHPNSMQVKVPIKSVGFVLGHGGSNIRQLREQSGARIQVADLREVETGRGVVRVELEGQPRAVETAKSLLSDRIKQWKQEEHMEDVDQEVALKFAVPRALIGHLIGRGGAVVKEFLKTGVLVKVLQDENSHTRVGDERPVLLVGPLNQVLDVQKKLLDHLATAPPNLLAQARGPPQPYPPQSGGPPPYQYDDRRDDRGYGGPPPPQQYAPPPQEPSSAYDPYAAAGSSAPPPHQYAPPSQQYGSAPSGYEDPSQPQYQYKPPQPPQQAPPPASQYAQPQQTQQAYSSGAYGSAAPAPAPAPAASSHYGSYAPAPAPQGGTSGGAYGTGSYGTQQTTASGSYGGQQTASGGSYGGQQTAASGSYGAQQTAASGSYGAQQAPAPAPATSLTPQVAHLLTALANLPASTTDITGLLGPALMGAAFQTQQSTTPAPAPASAASATSAYGSSAQQPATTAYGGYGAQTQPQQQAGSQAYTQATQQYGAYGQYQQPQQQQQQQQAKPPAQQQQYQQQYRGY